MSTSVQTNPAQADRLQWWHAARFGLFIHWGPVSLVGTEIGWSRGGERRGLNFTLPPGPVPVEQYDNLYKEFNPTQFNAAEWVQIAKDAGMRYLVFTTKHHDGFCNFDSALTDYKITGPNSPFGRDIVAELAAACHAANLPFGCYYSQPDWRHPDYRNENHQRYLDYFHTQVTELCTNYGEISVLWFDGLEEHFTRPDEIERYRGKEVLASAKIWGSETLFQQIRQLQPDILINNRCGMRADFDTPEQMIGAYQTDRAWESCITIGDQWAWKPNDRIKSLTECLHTLVRVAAGMATCSSMSARCPMVASNHARWSACEARFHPQAVRRTLSLRKRPRTQKRPSAWRMSSMASTQPPIRSLASKARTGCAPATPTCPSPVARRYIRC